MIYPKFIEKGDIIAVTAPSAGAADERKQARFAGAKAKLEELGHKIIYGDTVFRSIDKVRSETATVRANEFNQFVKNQDIAYISSAGGGDLLMEMLPMVDYEAFKNNPKWFQGYSDNTGLTFSLATLSDVATVYTSNYGDYGMRDWHRAIRENYEILSGKRTTQESFEFYEDEWHEGEDVLESYYEDKKVCVKGYLNGEEVDEISISGRLIGGCFDVVVDLAGTRFENFLGFCDKYKDDGIILYLESFEANTETTRRWLWKLRQLGWLDKINGIIFGRPLFISSGAEITYNEAVLESIADLGIPVIMDADIGHKPPQLTMINGAVAHFELKGNKSVLRYEFR